MMTEFADPAAMCDALGLDKELARTIQTLWTSVQEARGAPTIVMRSIVPLTTPRSQSIPTPDVYTVRFRLSTWVDKQWLDQLFMRAIDRPSRIYRYMDYTIACSDDIGRLLLDVHLGGPPHVGG